MKHRHSTIAPVLATLAVGAVVALGAAPAEAKCLPRSRCDAIKHQLRDFRESVEPLREEARELRREAREHAQGSEERRALRREARQLRRELRHERREHDVRRLVRQFRTGCRGC